jgi:sulfur-oxidizing protein SoxY
LSWKFVQALLIASLAIGMLDLAGFPARADASAQKDRWPELARDIFGERPLVDGSDVLAIEMPSRAEDAAIVPLTVRATLAPTEIRRVRSFTIVIDENPAPLAATFHIGSGAIVSAIATRVRINTYTNVHAVAELSDGKLYVVRTYVKASGGCSAPASKDVDRSGIGEMRLRQFSRAADLPASNLREAGIMVRHPNNSGLQMDQVTRLYVPAFFVQSVRIWQGEELLLAMEGSISISEDPNIRFTYRPNDAKTVRAEAIDTKGHLFRGEWPVATSRVPNPESEE